MRSIASSIIAIAVIGCLVCGCSTYTDYTRDAQFAVVDGNVDQAIYYLNEHLEVEQPDELPRTLGDDKVLFLLERATLLQATGNYQAAARDMMHIDDRLEWTDFTSETRDNILQFVYSDDSGPYRAPPHERLLLNSMNMINHLSLGDFESARVEARRFNVMQEYYFNHEPGQVVTAILGLGNYLAGVSFEASSEFESAARYYTQAYAFGLWPEPNEERLLDLINLSGYRGAGLGEHRDGVGNLFERAQARSRLSRSDYRHKHGTGDTLFVVQTGLVPYREAERIGLEKALTHSQRSRHASVHLDESTSEQALRLYTEGTINWLNVPAITNAGLPAPRSASLRVGHLTLELNSPVHLSEQIEDAWEEIANTALAAGISRAVARHGIGAGVGAATEAIASQSETLSGVSSLLGAIAGSSVQASLAAADTPDTRSWVSLPADIHLIRLQLPEGPQEVELAVNGRTDKRTINLRSDRFQLFNFSRLR